MKQLILTFFAVILCYSLFFDKESGRLIVDENNYIQESPQISGLPFIAPDTMNFLTLYDAAGWTAHPVTYIYISE